LRTRQIDAVATDNVILTGFVAAAPNELKLVGGRFTDERYGIGVRKGDTGFREWLNALLERIASDGRYAQAWQATLGRFESTPQAAPPVDRY
jgi:glutamate transport system substrate-binding protein